MDKLRFGVLTVSDRSSQGIRKDLSGPAIEEAIRAEGWNVVQRGIVPDDVSQIKQMLSAWSDSHDVDVILTTGGTGFAPRDITPEATLAVIERLAPGLTEATRQASLQVTPFAMLSRGVSGIRGKTLIINLPGSPKGAREHLQVLLPVLPHAIELLTEDPGAEQGHQNPPPLQS